MGTLEPHSSAILLLVHPTPRESLSRRSALRPSSLTPPFVRVRAFSLSRTARRSPPSCHVMVALTSLRRTTKCSSLDSVVPATLREIFPAFALRSPRSQELVSGPSSARRRRSHVPKQSVDRQVFLLIWCA